MNQHSRRRRADRIAQLLQLPEDASCAVCGHEIEPCLECEHVEYAGRIHWFCSDACRDEFDRVPQEYAGAEGGR